MIIELKKFGTTLSSRNDGRESFQAIQPGLKEMADGEELIINFSGVNTFSPSWGDEVIFSLFKKYDSKLILMNTENKSVEETLKLLEEINNVKFNMRKAS
jgi:hypothetical protein